MLELFPNGALSSSVTTTVWVGIVVIAFFNLRFGWVLSGLVVPGYMVPLLLIKPYSAYLIFFEGFLAYFLVKLYSDWVARTGIVSSLFGRDRFLAIVIVSVIVRIVFDIAVIPSASHYLYSQYGIYIDFQNDLHSFGLIIIALIANQLWVSGFVKGLPPLVVTMVVTYVVVRFGLMEYTNFSMSNIEFVYEDIASSILASPKAYIILIMSCFIAARLNLHYGWDFAGILIPSLLALQWYQPLKIFTTFIEAYVILVIAIFVLKSRVFGNANIEGARKLVLFFTIGYIYKWCLAHYLLAYHPNIKVTDLYGFGYLLATLIAMKMYDKAIAVRMTRIVLQTSVMGVCGASAVGFALTLIPIQLAQQSEIRDTDIVLSSDLSLNAHIDQHKLALYSSRASGVKPELTNQDRDNLIRLLREIRQADIQGFEALAEQMSETGEYGRWQLLHINNTYWQLSHSGDVGYGAVYIHPARREQSSLGVPDAIAEWGALDIASWMFAENDVRYLLVAGQAGDESQSSYHFFNVVYQYLALTDNLEIRGITAETARRVAGIRRAPEQLGFDGAQSYLWIMKEIPKGVRVEQIKAAVPNINIQWQSSPLTNPRRQWVKNAVAEIFLTRESMRSALSIAKNRDSRLAIHRVVNNKRISGYLQDTLYRSKAFIAPRASNLYVAPAAGDLLYLSEQLLEPLLETIRFDYFDQSFSESGLAELRALSAVASRYGYDIVLYKDIGRSTEYLVLLERDGNAALKRYWGTYVFRLGAYSPYVVEVPRPVYEQSSFEFGVSQFERLNAFALLIGGAHPLANHDLSADLIRASNKASFFNLTHQSIMTQLINDPLLIIQSRAFGYVSDRANSQADALISRFSNAGTVAESELYNNLYSLLERDGLSIQTVSGAPETAGYESHGVAQAQFLSASLNKIFTTIWLSPMARLSYQQHGSNKQQVWQARALDVPSTVVDLPRYLVQQIDDGWHAAPEYVINQMKHYTRAQNVNALVNVVRASDQIELHRLVDVNSKQNFYLVRHMQEKWWLLVNTLPREKSSPRRISKVTDFEIQAFIDRRAWGIQGG